MTTAESIEFAKKYGLAVGRSARHPGEKEGSRSAPTSAVIKELGASLAANKLKVSFMNTSLLKFTWPGMEPVRPPCGDTPEKKEKRVATEKVRFDRRMEDLGKALTAAKIIGWIE